MAYLDAASFEVESNAIRRAARSFSRFLEEGNRSPDDLHAHLRVFVLKLIATSGEIRTMSGGAVWGVAGMDAIEPEAIENALVAAAPVWDALKRSQPLPEDILSKLTDSVTRLSDAPSGPR